MAVAAETNTAVMENNDTQKVPMRIHQATTTDIQANNVKDNYALTIRKYQSAVLPILTKPCISEEEAVKGGSYDFADANDLGVQQRTEGSECNLLNPSIFMKLNLIMIKLE